MKRYAILAIALFALVATVSAGWSLNFQNAPDFSEHVAITCIPGFGTAGCGTGYWYQSSVGGNSYIRLDTVDRGSNYVVSQDPLLMTYSAATIEPGQWGTPCAIFYDVGMHKMGNTLCSNSGQNVGGRFEVKIVGQVPSLYKDSVYQRNVTVLAQNPHYIGWGVGCGNPFYGDCPNGKVDDIVWGTTESRYVFGDPEEGLYFIQKDIMNPAASGFYKVNVLDPNTPTLVTSGTFPSTFSKNSITNETVVFDSPVSGFPLRYYTGTAQRATISWDLNAFFASNAKYGLYRTEIDPQLDSNGYAVGEWIPYIGSGALIEFDKNSYAIGETAVITVTLTPGYYDTAVYSYHVTIQDAYGVEVSDQPITFDTTPTISGTVTQEWTDSNTEGVYYALIYAKQISDNEELLMNYDIAALASTLIVNGFVKHAETANGLSGATVNITQGTTTDSVTSGVDGNYTSISDFSSGAPTTIVAYKTNFETYTHTFTPDRAGVIEINLTLMPTNPTFTGIALGGIARTPPYNRTIDSALVDVVNTSDGHSYTATTNGAGYYIVNNMEGASHWFNVWGSKIGFSNSSIYYKLVFGS